MFRTFRLTEKFQLQFRAEAYEPDQHASVRTAGRDRYFGHVQLRRQREGAERVYADYFGEQRASAPVCAEADVLILPTSDQQWWQGSSL